MWCRSLAATLTVMTSTLWWPIAAAHADELYDLAAAEGEIHYYAQGPRQVYADLVAQFEAKYPRIKVHVTAGRYDVIDKINQQLANEGAPDVDVVSAQTVQDLVEWDRVGALIAFAPLGVETIPPHLRGRSFFPLSIYVVGMAFNGEKVSAAGAPRSVEEFLKPQFRDKIVSTFPHDDDVTLFLYSQIQRKYGWSFFSKLMEQNPHFVRSHVLVADAVKSGSHPITFDQITSFNGSQFVVPADLPLVVFPYGIAAFAKARHPNAAKLFIAFSLSKEQQQRFVARKVWSARDDVPAPEGFEKLASYHVADDFISFVSDKEDMRRLRTRFEQIIGPVTGEYISVAPNSAKP